MPEYSLAVRSFTPPTLPVVPADTPPSALRSPLIPSAVAATSPLRFTLSLPGARTNNPLHPATHLQLTFSYPGSGEVYLPDPTTPKQAVETEEQGVCEVEVRPEKLPRAKVNDRGSPDAEFRVNAWRHEKLLARFTVGVVKGPGIEGFKSFDLAKRRVEARKERAEKKAAA